MSQISIIVCYILHMAFRSIDLMNTILNNCTNKDQIAPNCDRSRYRLCKHCLLCLSSCPFIQVSFETRSNCITKSIQNTGIMNVFSFLALQILKYALFMNYHQFGYRYSKTMLTIIPLKTATAPLPLISFQLRFSFSSFLFSAIKKRYLNLIEHFRKMPSNTTTHRKCFPLYLNIY